MKAIVLEAYRSVALRDVPAPTPNGHDVIIKVSKCGICGSDYHAYYDRGDQLAGKVLGHEYSGYVVDPGARKDLKHGDRVTACPATGCGWCDLCLRGGSNLCGNGHEDHGAFAEFITATPEAVLKIPDSLTMEEAAMLEPLATSVRAVRNVGIEPGSTVLVIGAGIIGATCAATARVAGALRVVMAETNVERAKPLLESGVCDALYDATDSDILGKLQAENNGELYPYVFECAGAGPAMVLAINAVRKRGTIGMVGANPSDYPLNMRLPVVKEIRMQGSYAYDRLDFENGLKLVCAGRLSLKEYATKTIHIEEVPQAFEDLRTHKINDIKVMVDVEGSI